MLAWLSNGFHGEMAYMQTHGLKRARPAELVPGTVSVITARMDYLPPPRPKAGRRSNSSAWSRPREGIVSLYARGRDYHKVLRSRLQKLSDRIAAEVGPVRPSRVHRLGAGAGSRARHAQRPGLARQAHAGARPRSRVDVLPGRDLRGPGAAGQPSRRATTAAPASACIDVCPTQAIVAPYRLDARRCISYLTIEHAGAIPEELRPLIGNRIYGCDDCQLVCPWNKFARRSALPDFDERAGLTGRQLAELFAWTEEEFLRAHRRRPDPPHRPRALAAQRGGGDGQCIAAQDDAALRAALRERADHPSALVREHVAWALAA